MKLRLSQKDLASAAKTAARQLPSRPLTPILAGLLVEAADDRLTVSAFDLETSASATVPADVSEPGRIVVPGQLLADIAGILPGGDVGLQVVGSELLITCGGSRFNLILLTLQEYPRLPVLSAASGTVAGDRLSTAVAQAVGAAADQKDATGTLAAMAGINIAPDGDELVVTATNRYVVVQHRLPWEPSGLACAPITLPPSTLAGAARAAAGGDIHLSLPADGSTAGLAGSGFSSAMRIIDTPFPPSIAGLWPTELAATVEVDAAVLLAAVRRIALVAEDKTPLLCEFTADTLTLAAATGTAARGTEQIPVVMEGPDRFRICFQPHLLITGLQPLAGDIQIGLVTPTRPALIHAVDDPDSYRCLVMPVRHDWVKQ